VWSEDHPDARIAWQRRSLWAFGEAPLEEVVAAHDLVVIDHPFVGSAAEAGLLVPMEPELPRETLATLAAQSVGPSFESYVFDGLTWALPIDASGQASAWRPDLLDAIGAEPPSTWEEVERLARETRRVALPFAPIDVLCSFFTMCSQGGGEPARSPVRLVESPVGIAALERLLALAELVDPVCFERTPIATLDALANEDGIAFVPLAFAYSNHAREGFAAHRLAFGPPPGEPGATLGGAGLAVTAASPHRADAVAFAAWAADAATQRTVVVEHGGQPANRVAWEDERANALTGGFFRSLLPAFDRAFVRPNRPGFAAFQSEAAPFLHAALRERRPAEETLAGLEARYAGSSSSV